MKMGPKETHPQRGDEAASDRPTSTRKTGEAASALVVQSEKAADRSPASGAAGDLETVAKSTLGRIPKEKQPKRTAEEQRAEFERVAREHS